MSEASDQAELEVLEAMSKVAQILGHQIEQGRGTGIVGNLWYKATGTAEPKPLPTPTKPAH